MKSVLRYSFQFHWLLACLVGGTGLLLLFIVLEWSPFNTESNGEFVEALITASGIILLLLSAMLCYISWMQTRLIQQQQLKMHKQDQRQLLDQLEQETLEGQVRKFRSIFESNIIGIFYWKGHHGKITDANDAFLRLIGYSREDLVNGLINWQELTPQTSQVISMESRLSLKEQGQGFVSLEKYYRHKDGHLLPVRVSIACINFEQAHGVAIVESLDILRETQLALQESQTQFAAIADHAPALIWIADEKFQCTYMNKTLLEFTGEIGPTGQLIPLLDRIHPDDQPMVRKRAERLYREKGAASLEVRLRRNDDTYRWVLKLVRPRYNATGEFIGMIGMMMDITERKEAEIALQESEARFKNLADDVPFMIWMTGADMMPIYYNKAWLDFANRTMEESLAIALSPHWAIDYHPDDAVAMSAHYRECFAKQLPFRAEFRMKNQHDGLYHWLYSIGTPRFTKTGDFIGYIGCNIDITERKIAEAALEESEQRFRAMADNSPLMIWIMNENAELTYVNRAFAEFYEKTPEEILEHNWDWMIAPAQLPTIQGIIQDAIKTRSPYQLEVLTTNGEGIQRWIFAKGLPRIDSEGNFLGLIGSSMDIHDRKIMEQELALSETRFRQALDNAPIGMGLVSFDGKWIQVNKAMAEMLGYTQTEFLKRTWMEMTHPDDLDADVEQVNQLLAGHGNHYQMEKRYLRKDGTMIWGLLHVTLIHNSEGAPLYFISQIQDITESKAAKENLEAVVASRTRELQQNTQMLNSIIENVPAMIFMKDATNLRFVLFNKAAEAIVGLPKDEVLGKSDYDFFPTNQADFFIAKDRQTLIQNDQINIQEEPLQSHSGELRYLQTKKVPILDENGKPAYLLGISEDITQAKRAKEEIDSLNQQLQAQVNSLHALNKEMEAFSYSVSHDLRAPLRTIDGFSQAILSMYEDKLDERGRNYLQRLRQGSQQMGQLIDDMLDLSRLSRSEMKVEPDIDLSAIARRIAQELKQQNPERQVTFHIEDIAPVSGDQRLLEAVMQNLIGNAWKYTGKHEQATIEFGSFGTESCRVYFVKDDGAGFDMTYYNKLFGPFQRLHRASEFPGTGIGLATVQRIIHRHGGDVWGEGAIEKGTTFYFTLNAHRPKSTDASNEGDSMPAPASVPNEETTSTESHLTNSWPNTHYHPNGQNHQPMIDPEETSNADKQQEQSHPVS